MSRATKHPTANPNIPLPALHLLRYTLTMLRQKYPLAIYTLILCSLAGIIISAYLTYVHYGPKGGSFCDVSDYANCDIVNKSEYAVILGIPVAILGFLAYTTLFVGAIMLFRGKKILAAVTAFSGCGLLFSLYLSYIEFFVLETLCLMCFIQQILILTIFLISLVIWLKSRKLVLSL